MRPSSWIVVVALGFAAPRSSEACSCLGEPRIAPEDSAVGVPLNVRLFVQHAPDDTVGLRRQADGAPVAVTSLLVASSFSLGAGFIGTPGLTWAWTLRDGI